MARPWSVGDHETPALCQPDTGVNCESCLSTDPGWAPRRRPERHWPTFNRRHGVPYGFGAYYVHQDRLRLRRHRATADTLACLRTICCCCPRRLRIYWIQDGLSANWTPDVCELS
jgi:hypothetical protein